MEIVSLAIPEVKLIRPKLFKDTRGFFFESYRADVLHSHGITDAFIQHNSSRSKKGTLRGLHFQKDPYAQSKLVRVTSGSVFDVAVDIRKDSPTFGKWVSHVLSDDTFEMLYIPQGFAHGFYVLSEYADFFYLCNQYYSPQSEGSILYNDPTLNISWPIDPSTPLDLSAKDASAPAFLDLL